VRTDPVAAWLERNRLGCRDGQARTLAHQSKPPRAWRNDGRPIAV